jgi:hypothetical protein
MGKTCVKMIVTLLFATVAISGSASGQDNEVTQLLARIDGTGNILADSSADPTTRLFDHFGCAIKKSISLSNVTVEVTCSEMRVASRARLIKAMLLSNKSAEFFQMQPLHATAEVGCALSIAYIKEIFDAFDTLGFKAPPVSLKFLIETWDSDNAASANLALTTSVDRSSVESLTDEKSPSSYFERLAHLRDSKIAAGIEGDLRREDDGQDPSIEVSK